MCVGGMKVSFRVFGPGTRCTSALKWESICQD